MKISLREECTRCTNFVTMFSWKVLLRIVVCHSYHHLYVAVVVFGQMNACCVADEDRLQVN
jgi:hypothetical protein